MAAVKQACWLAVAALALQGAPRTQAATTHPLRAFALDCDSARHIGAESSGLSDGLCRMLCLKACSKYDTKGDIARCLERHEALDCMYEYDAGFVSKGTYCTDVMGSFAVTLQDEPVRRNLLRSSKIFVYIDIRLDKASAEWACKDDVPFMLGLKRQSIAMAPSGNVCSDSYAPVWDYTMSMPSSYLKRYDDYDLMLLDVSSYLETNKLSLGPPFVMVVTNGDCYGTSTNNPATAGLYMQERMPLTDFMPFLDV